MGTHMTKWINGIKIQDGEFQQEPRYYRRKKNGNSVTGEYNKYNLEIN